MSIDPVEAPDVRPVLVTVAALTFRRPQQIASLIPELLGQAEHVIDLNPGRFEIDVLVVDNDPAGSAAVPVRQIASRRLHYVNELTPGIAAARNRALAEVTDKDLLVFIDDDERPLRGWLLQLLEAQRVSNAAAVSGPVRSRFSAPLDPWILASGIYDRSHRQGIRSGATIDTAATNNLLLNLRVIRHLGLSFDQTLGLSGGEDSLFTRSLTSRGGKIVWCNEASVVEEVLVSRMTRRYIVELCYSHGNTAFRVRQQLARNNDQKARVRLTMAVGGTARLVFGCLRVLLGVALRSERSRSRGLCTAARGLGMLSGVAGFQHRAYRRT